MIAVNRPAWRAENDEQRRALEQAIRSARKADDADEVAWRDILAARKLRVPDTVLCEKTNRSRATLNRKYGRRANSPTT